LRQTSLARRESKLDYHQTPMLADWEVFGTQPLPIPHLPRAARNMSDLAVILTNLLF